MTGTAATLLTTELAGTSGDLTSLLRLGITLALVGQILLHIQINHMVIRFNAVDSIVQSYLASGLLTFDI